MIKAEIHTQAGTYYIDLPEATDLDDGIKQIAAAMADMYKEGKPLQPTAGERLLIEPGNTVLHIRTFEADADPMDSRVEPPPPNYIGQSRTGLDDVILHTEVLKQPLTIKGRLYMVEAADDPTHYYGYFMPTTVKDDWIYNRLNRDMAKKATLDAIDLYGDDFEVLMPPIEFNETTEPEELDAYLVDYVKEVEAEKVRPVGEKTARASYVFGYDKHKGTE